MLPLLDVELTDFGRRSRSLPLRHAATGLVAPLTAGDAVVIRDEAGEFFSATVADVETRDGDADYRLQLGVRLPSELALDRVAGFPRASTGLQELLDLIGEARRELPRRPPPEIAPLTLPTAHGRP